MRADCEPRYNPCRACDDCEASREVARAEAERVLDRLEREVSDLIVSARDRLTDLGFEDAAEELDVTGFDVTLAREAVER